jgi:predicted small integral membrane protein
MWESLQDNLAWMAWTWQVGVFFASIAVLLLIFTLLAAYVPETPRVGVLAIATTRGDRLFITLLGSALIHVLWLAFAPADWDLWWATGLSLVFAVAVFRWV